MKTSERELQELISELRIHFDKVQEKVAWLELKHSELHPDDEMSLFGFLDAQQNLAIEKSLLSGHALMVQEDIQKKRITTDPQTTKMLKEIVNSSRSLYM